jgi:choline kinase
MTKNPKVIILAAGEGQRLRPLTNDRPKTLVEYQGKPLIDYTINTLKEVGLTEIVIVGGYLGDMLRSRASRFYLNNEYSSTNMVYSLFCAEKELNQDVIISYGDITYKQNVIEALLRSQEDISVVVDLEWQKLWSQRMENPLDDAESLKLNGNLEIKEIGNKCSDIRDIQGQYIGLIKFSAEALNRVKNFYHSLDKNSTYRGKSFNQMYMTTFLQMIIDNLMPVKAVTVHGGWIEIDSVEDLNCSMV